MIQTDLRLADLPEYPTLEPVYIRRLTFRERIDWEKAQKKANSEPIKSLLLLVLVDADKKQRFTAEQIDELEAPLVLQLWYQAGAHNLIDGEDIEKLKNDCRKERN